MFRLASPDLQLQGLINCTLGKPCGPIEVPLSATSARLWSVHQIAVFVGVRVWEFEKYLPAQPPPLTMHHLAQSDRTSLTQFSYTCTRRYAGGSPVSH